MVDGWWVVGDGRVLHVAVPSRLNKDKGHSIPTNRYPRNRQADTNHPSLPSLSSLSSPAHSSTARTDALRGTGTAQPCRTADRIISQPSISVASLGRSSSLVLVPLCHSRLPLHCFLGLIAPHTPISTPTPTPTRSLPFSFSSPHPSHHAANQSLYHGPQNQRSRRARLRSQ
jgi:hypothetical protein